MVHRTRCQQDGAIHPQKDLIAEGRANTLLQWTPKNLLGERNRRGVRRPSGHPIPAISRPQNSTQKENSPATLQSVIWTYSCRRTHGDYFGPDGALPSLQPAALNIINADPNPWPIPDSRNGSFGFRIPYYSHSDMYRVSHVKCSTGESHD
jgi:hypothetical protein